MLGALAARQRFERMCRRNHVLGLRDEARVQDLAHANDRLRISRRLPRTWCTAKHGRSVEFVMAACHDRYMEPLALFLSASGRVAAKPFAIAIVVVYLVGFASQALLATPVTARSGLWPFILLQAALMWCWVALHAKRLRDAELGIEPAIGIAIVYGLALTLMLLVIVFFIGLDERVAAEQGERGPANTFLALMLILYVLGMLFSPDFGAIAWMLLMLVLLTFLPILIGFVFSIWAGTKPTAGPAPAEAVAP